MGTINAHYIIKVRHSLLKHVHSNPARCIFFSPKVEPGLEIELGGGSLSEMSDTSLSQVAYPGDLGLLKKDLDFFSYFQPKCVLRDTF